MNVHQRVASADALLCRYLLQDNSLFLQPLLSSPNGLMNKLSVMAEMEVTLKLSNMDFYSPRPTWL